jgi:hypothetical protein
LRPGKKKLFVSRGAFFGALSLVLIMFSLRCTEARTFSASPDSLSTVFYPADNEYIRYIGRIDFKDPARPRFWQPGVTIEALFEGPSCKIIVRDQQLWGKNQNYLQVIVDGHSSRIQTTGPVDTIEVANGLSDMQHRLLICKNTEANIGWLEFDGLICQKLLQLPTAPLRKIEFIGNSITCGTGADISSVPCGKGEWHDQHNAYLSYGPRVARNLNAQWHLSAVSGIGLIRSCCNMSVLMPEVYDNIEMRGDSLKWDFDNYHPDVITICLGQNDGIQDSVRFCSAYVQFIHSLREYHPKAEIICMTSPMGDAALTATLKRYLTGVVHEVVKNGDPRVDKFFFSRQFSSGCDFHPDLSEHKEMALELSGYIKEKMDW